MIDRSNLSSFWKEIEKRLGHKMGLKIPSSSGIILDVDLQGKGFRGAYASEYVHLDGQRFEDAYLIDIDNIDQERVESLGVHESAHRLYWWNLCMKSYTPFYPYEFRRGELEGLLKESGGNESLAKEDKFYRCLLSETFAFYSQIALLGSHELEVIRYLLPNVDTMDSLIARTKEDKEEFIEWIKSGIIKDINIFNYHANYAGASVAKKLFQNGRSNQEIRDFFLEERLAEQDSRTDFLYSRFCDLFALL